MLLAAFDNINENAIMQFEIEIKAKMSLIFLMMFKNDFYYPYLRYTRCMQIEKISNLVFINQEHLID